MRLKAEPRKRRSRPYRIVQRELRDLLRLAVHLGKDDREICGLIVDNGWSLELVRLPNRTRRRAAFRMTADDIKVVQRAARRLGHQVIGSFHSHPAYFARSGPGDIRDGEIGSLMLVLDCIGRETRLWRIGRKRSVHEVPLEFI